MNERLRSRRSVVTPSAVVVLVPMLILLIWAAASEARVVQRVFLPSPGDVVAALLDLVRNGFHGRSFWDHAARSLTTLSLGLATGLIIGTALGLAMGYSRIAEGYFSPMVEFLRPLPQLSYLVLIIVSLGIGQVAQIALLFLAALPVAAIATRDGIRNADIQRQHVAVALGASRYQLFRYVVLPSALPSIFAGFRIAVGVVYTTIIAAEMISGTAGLGWIVLQSLRDLASAYIFASVLVLGMAGLVIDSATMWLERRVVHWAGVE